MVPTEQIIMKWLRSQPWYDHSRDDALDHCMEYSSLPYVRPGGGVSWGDVFFLNRLAGYDEHIPALKAAVEAEISEQQDRQQHHVMAAIAEAVGKLNALGVPASTLYLPNHLRRLNNTHYLLGMKVVWLPAGSQPFVTSTPEFGRFVEIDLDS